jgi:hypothetical protein
MTRLRPMHIDANQSRRLGAGEGALRVLQIGDQADAALIVGFAVQRRPDVAGRSLQKPHAQSRFQPLHRIGDRGPG